MGDSQLKNYAILVSETYDRWATVAFDLPSAVEKCRKQGLDGEDVSMEVYYQSGTVVAIDAEKLSIMVPAFDREGSTYQRLEWLPDSELIAIEEAGFAAAIAVEEKDNA